MLNDEMESVSDAGLQMLNSSVSEEVTGILNLALEGKDISDELRRRSVGDLVTFVVNRNINFTNVCIKRCGFCAFSRDFREEQGYFLPINEIIRRSKEAWDYGATEVCIQAGLPPKMEGDLYVRLCEAIKEELPDIHIHGFSPEEVLYGSVRSNVSIRQYLKDLKNAGVGSLPGTSAEILDQKMRDEISPGRITVDQWTEVITNAHDLDIPTTSTIMFGHVETNKHIAEHISYIRDIQKSTGGFTEFVPLSFVNSEAPMFLKGLVQNVRTGPTGMDVMKVHAVARIMLNNWIPNIQASWVKEGDRMSQLLLNAGVNDLGGTLINESISTSAGAQHGQLMKPSSFRDMIRDCGRTPAERYTSYEVRKIFDSEDQESAPLDYVGENVEEIFGSYNKLIALEEFRFDHPRKTKSVKE